LQAPRFTLYHGRKSCPLGLPPDPRLLEADDLGTALAAYGRASPARQVLRRSTGPGTLHADFGLLDLLGPRWRVERIVERRDEPGDRRRWQFAMRQELVAHPTRTAA
jgi:CRISPR system Cascade subunit CasD